MGPTAAASTLGDKCNAVAWAIVMTTALRSVAGCNPTAAAPSEELLGADAGASAAPDASAQRPLCDGSPNLVLRIFFQNRGELMGDTVRVENGNPSFAVDGQCQYFVSGGWGNEDRARDIGWRQGHLIENIAQTLEREVGMADLPSAYPCSEGAPADAPPLIVANVQSRVGCYRAGAKLFALFIRMQSLARGLWAIGKPLDGDLHIMVRETCCGLELAPTYAWPSGIQLSDYLVKLSAFDGRTEPPTKLVPAVDAASIRAVREQYLRDDDRAFGLTAGIPVTDGSVLATMFLRDALPYEDDRGLWPLPGN